MPNSAAVDGDGYGMGCLVCEPPMGGSLVSQLVKLGQTVGILSYILLYFLFDC